MKLDIKICMGCEYGRHMWSDTGAVGVRFVEQICMRDGYVSYMPEPVPDNCPRFLEYVLKEISDNADTG